MHKATEGESRRNKRISLGIFIVSPEPVLQLFCSTCMVVYSEYQKQAIEAIDDNVTVGVISGEKF